MKRWTQIAVVVFVVIVMAGCSGSSNSPLTPDSDLDITAAQSDTAKTQNHLWGYYDVFVDIPSQTVEAIPNRNVMFTANVTTFVNGSPANLAFNIKSTPIGVDFIDVDIDVTITHPFPGLTQYNGYDVKGIFIGNGSATLGYNSALKYAQAGSDQEVRDYNEPPAATDEYGNPDGYTRWWNPTEFTQAGIFGYTKGIYATTGYNATATLNPYKLYADGLDATEDAFDFLSSTSGNAVFSAGSSNTRNYYIRFPNSVGVKFSYAIAATWQGEDPEDHPANAVETPSIRVVQTPDAYYVDNSNKGGDIILDVDVIGWNYQPSTIIVETPILSSNYQFNAGDMTPVGSGTNYSTYHVEIPATNLTSNEDTEAWIIAQYTNFNYDSGFGSPAPSSPLAAFFKVPLVILEEAPAPDLYKETFDTGDGGWYFTNFNYMSGLWPCTQEPLPSYTTIGPNGPSSAGNVRFPPTGVLASDAWGGYVTTAVSPPFLVPSEATNAWVRIYMAAECTSAWGSYYAGFNWKISQNSTTGMAPFNQDGSLGFGILMMNVKTDTSQIPNYNGGSSHGGQGGAPWNGQDAWHGPIGGGTFPGNLTDYVDLQIPPAMIGNQVKIAFQMLPDYCYPYYPGYYFNVIHGFAIDDVELMIE